MIDFDAAARLALRKSPHFTKSALEIEVRRLDEKDSHADFLPTVNLRTRYYANQPSRAGLNDPNRYVLDINTDGYNPLIAYFALRWPAEASWRRRFRPGIAASPARHTDRRNPSHRRTAQ